MTCAEYPDGYFDDVPLVSPARRPRHRRAVRGLGRSGRRLGARSTLTILRSTWDYPPRRDEFLAWAATVPNLLNPLDVVRWSSDKRYLRDLVASRRPVRSLDVRRTVGSLADADDVVRSKSPPDAARFVVKPSVGAGSIDAGRFESRRPVGRRAGREDTSGSLGESGRAAMVQPYLDGDRRRPARRPLIYIDGECSHADPQGADAARRARPRSTGCSATNARRRSRRPPPNWPRPTHCSPRHRSRRRPALRPGRPAARTRWRAAAARARARRAVALPGGSARCGRAVRRGDRGAVPWLSNRSADAVRRSCPSISGANVRGIIPALLGPAGWSQPAGVVPGAGPPRRPGGAAHPRRARLGPVPGATPHHLPVLSGLTGSGDHHRGADDHGDRTQLDRHRADARRARVDRLPDDGQGRGHQRAAVDGRCQGRPSGDRRRSLPPRDVQPFQPFMGVEVPVISPSELEGSAFTEAHLRGSRPVGYRAPSAIAVEVSRQLAAGERFVYAYYGSIDKTAHERGFGEYYEAELHTADRLVGDLLDALPSGAALLVTADHGQVEVGDRVIEPSPELLAMVAAQSGEGRFRWWHTGRVVAGRGLQGGDRRLRRRGVGRDEGADARRGLVRPDRRAAGRRRASATSRSSPASRSASSTRSTPARSRSSAGTARSPAPRSACRCSRPTPDRSRTPDSSLPLRTERNDD